jgi:hypothetical protein
MPEFAQFQSGDGDAEMSLYIETSPQFLPCVIDDAQGDAERFGGLSRSSH